MSGEKTNYQRWAEMMDLAVKLATDGDLESARFALDLAREFRLACNFVEESHKKPDAPVKMAKARAVGAGGLGDAADKLRRANNQIKDERRHSKKDPNFG